MLKKFRPTTAGQRHLVLTKQEALSRVKPEKSLIEKKKRTNGRNHHGHITCRHKGGGHKRFYRLVDFIAFNIDYCTNSKALIDRADNICS